MTEKHLCPRRSEIGQRGNRDGAAPDTWTRSRGAARCSYCGSLHPDTFMEWAATGGRLDPSTKNYKVYIASPDGQDSAKFYWPHLSDEQKGAFIALFNERRLTMATMVADGEILTFPLDPLPYFMRYADAAPSREASA